MEGPHFTSEVFIVHKGRVFLHKHQKLGIWLSVGGHLEPGEDQNQGALREVKEETGLDVRLWDGEKQFHVDEGQFHNLVPPVALNRHITGNGHDHVTCVFFATTDTDKVHLEDPAIEFCWASKENLEKMELLPNVREYAEGALKALA